MVRVWSCLALAITLTVTGCSPTPGVQQYDVLLAQANDPPPLPPPPVAPATTPPPVAPAEEPEERRSPLAPVMYYIPNRIKDLFDIFSLGIAPPSIPYLFPSSAHANVHATRALQAGLGTTEGIFLGKSYDNDFAWKYEHNELSILPLTICELEHESDHQSEVTKVGMLFPSDEPFEEGEMDYWAVGAHAGLLVVAVQADVHPVELLDAVLGFLFIDIMGDDL